MACRDAAETQGCFADEWVMAGTLLKISNVPSLNCYKSPFMAPLERSRDFTGGLQGTSERKRRAGTSMTAEVSTCPSLTGRSLQLFEKKTRPHLATLTWLASPL